MCEVERVSRECELKRVKWECDGFFCRMSVAYDGAVLL